MISHLGNLAAWEWFKLRQRRITWVLLGLLILISALTVSLRFANYQFTKDAPVRDELAFLLGVPGTHTLEIDIDCEPFLQGEPPPLPEGFTEADVDRPRTVERCEQEALVRKDQLEVLKNDITLPGSIPKALRWTHLLGIPLIAFFTVLTLGSEYAWGTLRTVLMKATGRWQYFTVKLGVVAVASLCAWLIVLVTIVATSLIASVAAGVGDADFLDVGFFADTAGDVGRVWFAGLPYVALAAAATVAFTTSTSGGMFSAMALAMSYYLIDLSSVGRLLNLFDGVSGFGWFATLADFDLGWNTAAWMLSEQGMPVPGFAIGGAIGVADYPGELHSLYLGFGV